MASGLIWAVPLFYHLISFCWAVFVEGHSRRFNTIPGEGGERWDRDVALLKFFG